MSKKLYEETNIQGIADAIREKNSTQNQYTVAQMPAAVRAIETQPDLEILNVTENGNYLPSAGKDGFSEVLVAVGDGEAVIQPLSITQNGTYTPPTGVDGYAPVTVNVSGGESEDEPTVYWGDEEPLSNLGNDGDIYICGNVYVFRDSGGKVLCVVNKDYVVTSTSQILSTHSLVFRKTVEGPAIAIECLTARYYGYKGPLLISPVEDYVKYTGNTSPWGHIDVDDVTWYISSSSMYDQSGDSPSIPTYYDLAANLGDVPSSFNSTYAEALVRKFLELAAPSSYGSVYVKRNGAWEIMTKELNFETLYAINNGQYVPSLGKDGFGEVIVNVARGGIKGFEVYAADGNGDQRVNYGILDNSYFVCFFDDNMSNAYTLNGVLDTYSTLATGKTGSNGLKATTRGVVNTSAVPVNDSIPKAGSVFTASHGDSGSYVSVVGGWVGYPAGGTIYESAAVGTSNSVTLNSAHGTLLIFVGASSNTEGVTTIDLNGATYSIENIGLHFGAYGMYTAIKIEENTDTNITVTFPADCWSYVSVIGIDA